MSRTTGIALSLAIFLNACIPALPFIQPATPTQVMATDQVAPATLTTETPIPTGSATVAPSVTLLVSSAASTGTATGTEPVPENPTATETTVLVQESGTQPTAIQTNSPSSATGSDPAATETLHPRFFGTLPPAISFGKIKLVNKAKAEVYVSLQCTTQEGMSTILEYPVKGTFRISAPSGRYVYVVWAGGRQMSGSFSLHKAQEITLTVFKDKVTIK